MHTLSRIVSLCALILSISLTPNLYSCTGFKLAAKNGSVVHGRTLEFGVVVESAVAVVPRGFEFTATAPEGPGLKYQSKYAAVGMIAFGNLALLDGMNEQGLSIGTFFFPGFAAYAPITAENQAKALSPIDFPNWVLTTCATLDEVKTALANIAIAPTIIKKWGNTPPPFHYVIYDKSGNALVVEPLDGKLVVRDNPLGVLTNSPTFDWQMTNLRNYINLTPWNVKPLTLNGATLAPFGQGSGMVGMPGDFTPPSRFVRAAIFSTTAVPSENADDAVFQAFHILNQFDIPVGVIRQKENGQVGTDSTQATCVRDPSSLKYYFKTYNDQSIKMVDLKKFDLNAKTIMQANTTGKEIAQDITATLK